MNWKRRLVFLTLLVSSCSLNEEAVCLGEKIAFVEQDPKNRFNIVMLCLENRQQIKITSGRQNGEPAWAPDGSRLAYSSVRNGERDIYITDSTGTYSFNLTQTPSIVEGFPAWSPDGRLIAFAGVEPGNDEDIFLIQTDGSDQLNLTNRLGSEGYPSWSPDGTRIAFMNRSRAWKQGREQAEIYVANIISGSVSETNITNHPSDDYYPAWSPNGMTIAFTSERDGNPEIYLMEIDGSNVRRLTRNPAIDGYPAWSPDGEKLAFYSRRTGNGDIYIKDLRSGDLVRLTESVNPEFRPAWTKSITK